MKFSSFLSSCTLECERWVEWRLCVASRRFHTFWFDWNDVIASRQLKCSSMNGLDWESWAWTWRERQSAWVIEWTVQGGGMKASIGMRQHLCLERTFNEWNFRISRSSHRLMSYRSANRQKLSKFKPIPNYFKFIHSHFIHFTSLRTITKP